MNTSVRPQVLEILQLNVEILPVEIGNYVWIDEDNNGLQDAGEQGIKQVTRLVICDESCTPDRYNNYRQQMETIHLTTPMLISDGDGDNGWIGSRKEILHVSLDPKSI